MSTHLISEIDRFLTETGMGEFRFGIAAARNGRLVARLRAGGRVWPETEAQVRAFIIAQRGTQRPTVAKKAGRQADGAAA